MISYGNITQASALSEWLQSETLEKENTKQSNINSLWPSVLYLLECQDSTNVYEGEEKKREKLGRNITKSAGMKDVGMKEIVG